MYINELKNSKLKITAIVAKQSIDFDVNQVLNIKNKDKKILDKISKKVPYIIINPIMVSGKMLNFSSNKIISKITATVDNMIYEWNIIVRNVQLPYSKKSYHIVFSEKNVKPINRRNNYRVWLGYTSIIQINSNRKTDEAIVKDISAGGVGIIIDKNMMANIGDTVHLVFNEPSNNIKFNLSAIIVRKENISGKIIIGCRFNKISSEIEKYVNKKQVEKMKSNNS